MKTILVAIDGSDASVKALTTAIQEAKAWEGSLYAVYVIEKGGLEDIPEDANQELLYAAFEKAGNTVLSKAKRLAAESDVEITTEIRFGHAGNEILKMAEEIGADSIVLGSHGRSGIESLLLGSVSSHVVRHSTVTTMVVRS